MSSDSETDDGSYTDTDFSDEVSCSFPNEPCRSVPEPIRRLVDIQEPTSQPRYNFQVSYNERVPTGSRIEIAPNQRQLPYKPRAPLPPGERDQTDTMWGGRWGTHDRTEMQGFERSKQNTNGMPLDKFSPASYPFASDDGFNTKNQLLGGIGMLPQFGSRVKQGMGDVSQQILERYTGKRGFQQPKREVELSHPRHRQLPNKMVDLGDQMQRTKDSLADKKPFELPFQQGRDTGNRTMPFGGDPLQPPIRVIPTEALRNTQNLNVRVNNLPSQAQSNPNGNWMQGTGPLPESREVMFDYSDQLRTPAPGPTTAFQPPLLQAPIRVPVTNRADTSVDWRGPVNNSSANAVQMPENFQNMKVKILPQENFYLGPVGNDSAGAPGHVATHYEAKMTQREGYDFTPQPGPAFGGGQAPMPLMDQMRATQKEQLVQEVILPRIVRSGIGAGPMPIMDQQRATGKEISVMSTIQAPMQNTVGGSGPMPLMDQQRPTLRQALEEVIQQPRQQLPQGGAGPMPLLDQQRPTLRQTTDTIVQQPRQQLPQGGTGPMPLMDQQRATLRQTTDGLVQQPRQQLPQGGTGPMPLMDQQRTTMKQATESAVQQGRINSMIGGGAGPMPQLDPARPTQREGTGQFVMAGNIGGAATGTAPTRRYDDEQRETRRQTMAENPELGPAFNSSASAGGHLVTGVQVPLTERNMGCLEQTHSFGPVSSDVKNPTDRTYIQNMTIDDRKQVGIYNRIPGPDRFPNIPKTIYPQMSMPSDDRMDTTRTANIDLSRENQRRMVPLQSFNPNKDLPQLDQNRFIHPYQTEQLRMNPYATDIRVMAGQPQY